MEKSEDELISSETDEETQQYVYNLICEKVILKYDSGKLGIDDVSTSDEFADE